MTPSTPAPLVAVIMGSKSDWETIKHASETLTRFGVPHESRVLSAHRTPLAATEFASGASHRGLQVIIAAAGGAAHLAGVLAAHTILPVLGVPMESQMLRGMDSLLCSVRICMRNSKPSARSKPRRSSTKPSERHAAQKLNGTRTTHSTHAVHGS